VQFRGLSGELCFETEEFDAFAGKLAGLELIHPPNCGVSVLFASMTPTVI
jgi:hypothetical protein